MPHQIIMTDAYIINTELISFRRDYIAIFPSSGQIIVLHRFGYLAIERYEDLFVSSNNLPAVAVELLCYRNIFPTFKMLPHTLVAQSTSGKMTSRNFATVLLTIKKIPLPLTSLLKKRNE